MNFADADKLLNVIKIVPKYNYLQFFSNVFIYLIKYFFRI